jgi:hypothetical protein
VKPVVVRSLNDATGTRCVDVRQVAGGFEWVECRRDPEDGHGWRVIGAATGGYASVEAAMDGARAHVGWLA